MAKPKKPASGPRKPRKPKATTLPAIQILPPEPQPKRRPGRPSKYTTALGQMICDMVAGRISLVAICDAEGMPSRDTVYGWKRTIPEFSTMYARAREHRAEARADEIDGIIEKLHLGRIDPQVARVIIDAEKWMMARENSRLYGDKVALTDPDGGALVVKFAV